MLKKIITIVMFIFVLIGIIIGIKFSVKQNVKNVSLDAPYINILENVQTKKVKLDNFFTYGQSFNISGKLDGISKDNFESAKLYISDGKEYERSYKLGAFFENRKIICNIKFY